MMSPSAEMLQLIKTLRNAGIDLPKAIIEAESKAKLQPTDKYNVNDAKAALAAADNQDDYDRLAVALQTALAVAGVDEGLMARHLAEVRADVLKAAILPEVDTLVGSVCELFNSSAPAFEDAAKRVPQDLAAVGALDVTPATAQALQDARSAVAPLATTLSAYNSLARFSGHKDQNGRSADSASVIVSRIGDMPDAMAYRSAVRDVMAASNNDKGYLLKPLAPYVGITHAGGVLSLVPFTEAKSRLITINEY